MRQLFGFSVRCRRRPRGLAPSMRLRHGATVISAGSRRSDSPLTLLHRLHDIPRSQVIQVSLCRPQRGMPQRRLNDRHGCPLPHQLERHRMPQPVRMNPLRGAGKPLRHSNFRQRVWLPALKTVSLEGLRIHDLRHTCASLMISAGAHPKAVQAQLGHSSITVTMDRYGHLFPSDQEDLANRLDARHKASSETVVPSLRPVEELAARGTN